MSENQNPQLPQIELCIEPGALNAVEALKLRPGMRLEFESVQDLEATIKISGVVVVVGKISLRADVLSFDVTKCALRNLSIKSVDQATLEPNLRLPS